MVLKSGIIVWAQMGDANASILTVQPAYGHPMWSSLPRSAAHNLYTFVSNHAFDKDIAVLYGLSKNVAPIIDCQSVTKKDMKWTNMLPVMSVDPESYGVCVDGILADVELAWEVPLMKEFYPEHEDPSTWELDTDTDYQQNPTDQRVDHPQDHQVDNYDEDSWETTRHKRRLPMVPRKPRPFPMGPPGGSQTRLPEAWTRPDNQTTEGSRPHPRAEPPADRPPTPTPSP
ncbi:hypothetical protein SCLCIDRAFT_29592 [Scleroderma citrinum Foug A]|uniref:Urease domain-containing protein n=1 Tax=Scleroderma citrinum Foug A TaxID=1036808 RepID=A0A0C2Z3F9_9AGAM|nr:hypothetical protein SCLCIDRAFT_29592 [Scleroderma citrinum Foug A]